MGSEMEKMCYLGGQNEELCDVNGQIMMFRDYKVLHITPF